MDIPYCTEARILGFHISSPVNDSSRKGWSMETTKIRAQAQDIYHRVMSLNNMMHYVHDYLLVMAWYTSQIFPPPEDSVLQLNMTTPWYLWKGEIFRVPLTKVYMKKEDGGWNLVNLTAKFSDIPLSDAGTSTADGHDVCRLVDVEIADSPQESARKGSNT
jgi:hypothetical protein